MLQVAFSKGRLQMNKSGCKVITNENYLVFLHFSLAHLGQPCPCNKLPACGDHSYLHTLQRTCIGSFERVYYPNTSISGFITSSCCTTSFVFFKYVFPLLLAIPLLTKTTKRETTFKEHIRQNKRRM